MSFIDPSNFASAVQGAEAATALQVLPARLFMAGVARTIITSTTDPGFTLSATRDAFVTYSVTTTTTATIGGTSNWWVVLEMAPPTWSQASDWVEKARSGNSQSITLAITLQSVQATANPLKAILPAGWYARLRSISQGTGTNAPTYAFNSAQEVLL